MCNRKPKAELLLKIPVTFYFPEGISYTPQPLYVKVNVIDRQLTQKDIKWRGSYVINVINRNNSEVIAQPIISGINASLVSAVFSGKDREMGMDQTFSLGVEEGKLIVRLKPGVFCVYERNEHNSA